MCIGLICWNDRREKKEGFKIWLPWKTRQLLLLVEQDVVLAKGVLYFHLKERMKVNSSKFDEKDEPKEPVIEILQERVPRY